MGPIEFIVIGFDGNRFSGEIMPEVRSLKEKGMIRILDLLFVTKDYNGETRAVELSELPDLQSEALGLPEEDPDGWFSIDDVEWIGNSMEPVSSVAMLLFEHLWASRLSETVRNANGELLVDERIPVRLAEELAAKRGQVTEDVRL